MKSCLSHVALLVPSLEESAAFLNARGIQTGQPEVFEAEGTKEVYCGSYAKQRGLLLLLEAVSDGPYRRAMLKRGPSLHHIAIDVLNLEASVQKAKNAGWCLHSESVNTIAYKTAWLYSKQIPALIEVQEKQELSGLPLQVSNLQLPIESSNLNLFTAIGLADFISCGPEVAFTLDGGTLKFSEVARIR